MALGKIKATLYGVNATYWRIAQSNIDWVNKNLFITLAGYVSAEARQSGAEPIAQDSMLLSGGEFPLLTPAEGDIRSIVYIKVKEDSEWSEAEDI